MTTTTKNTPTAGDPAASTQAESGAAEAPAVGDLVELHDGSYAIVHGVDPLALLVLGRPVRHDLPVSVVR